MERFVLKVHWDRPVGMSAGAKLWIREHPANEGT